MSKEMITAMSAAQRLGQSVAEVEALWKAGKIKGKKEFSTLYLEKESVYAYSGITEGKQNKKRAGRKPNVMSLNDTAAYLHIDIAGVKALVEDGTFEVVEGKGGVRWIRESQVGLYAKNNQEEVAMSKTEKTSTKNENVRETLADMPKAKSDDTLHAKASEESKVSQDRGKTYTEQTKGSETAEPQEQTSKRGATAKDADNVEKDRVGSEDAGVKIDPDMSLDDVMKSLFPGIQHMDKAVRALALGGCKKCVKKYNTHDMKEVADMAYKMGKLAVYESMDSFQRKRPEQLAKAKAKA